MITFLLRKITSTKIMKKIDNLFLRVREFQWLPAVHLPQIQHCEKYISEELVFHFHWHLLEHTVGRVFEEGKGIKNSSVRYKMIDIQRSKLVAEKVNFENYWFKPCFLKKTWMTEITALDYSRNRKQTDVLQELCRTERNLTCVNKE